MYTYLYNEIENAEVGGNGDAKKQVKDRWLDPENKLHDLFRSYLTRKTGPHCVYQNYCSKANLTCFLHYIK